MGKFIDTPNERSIVNNYVDDYMSATSKYAKFLDSVPNFVTYYSRDFVSSTEDHGLGTIKEVVGLESPVKYNKIFNMPLYGVDEVSPNLTAEDLGGLDNEMQGNAILIPDTIVPQPDDLFLFSYHEATEETYKLYRVTNVTTSAIDSNTYYQISFIVTPYDLNILNERQVKDDYSVIMNNIGTEQKSIILDEDYIKARQFDLISSELADLYIDDYYDSKLNLFLFNDVLRDRIIYDPSIHEMISKTSMFINQKTLASNLYITNVYPLKNRVYFNSISGIITNKEKLKDISFPIGVMFGSLTTSLFRLFPYEYLATEYYKGENSYSHQLLHTDINLHVNGYNKDIVLEDIDGLTNFERLMIYYIKEPSMINSDLCNECLNDIQYSSNPVTLSNYIFTPIILYILQDMITQLIK